MPPHQARERSAAMRAEPRGGGPRPHRSGILGILRPFGRHAPATPMPNEPTSAIELEWSTLQNNHEQYERGLLWLCCWR